MNAQFVDIPASIYHQDFTAQSRSMLWRFRERREAYKAEFVDCTRPPKKPSDVMLMGTLAHAGMLHPESLDQLYAVYPEDVLGSKGRKGTNAAREFEEQAAKDNKIVLKAEQMEIVRAMVASVQAKLESWLKLKSIRERAIYWVNKESGLLCRCMPDWLILTKNMAYGFDLKTTGSAHPDDFAKKVHDYGYWFQDRHYSEGISAVTGLPCQFRFVVVESDFPNVCALEEICPIHLPEAGEARIKTLKDVKQCLATGDFSEPWSRKIEQIVLRPGCFDEAA